ncbi:MAG: hypothetical protein VX589_09240 [Myxococcota bacterium]|nr:hypothetical protein [Myxococcota bacterium]
MRAYFGFFACLLAVCPWSQASAIERGCDARYEITVHAGSKSLTSTPLSIGTFRSIGSCGRFVPNRCRRRARDGAHSCMSAHSKSTGSKNLKACTGKVRNYPFASKSLTAAIKSKACEVAQAKGKKTVFAKLRGVTSGDTGCPKSAVYISQRKIVCPTKASSKSPKTLTVQQANATFNHRRDHLIQVWLDSMANERKRQGNSWLKGIGSFKKEGGTITFRRIAAGLMALKLKQAKYRKSFRNMPPSNFPAIVEVWTKTIHKHGIAGTSGTEGDYDMLMKEMIALLYRFKHDKNLLTNKAVFNIVDRGLKHYRGQSFGTKMRFQIMGITFPETENHTLMTYGSIYLTNQFIRQNPRKLSALRKGIYKNQAPFNNAGGQIEDFLFQAASRVLHAGFFETNARPYQSISFHALLNLAEFAANPKLRMAARNALDFLSTKYAFQSFQGQRFTPNRRNHKPAYNHKFNYMDTDGTMSIYLALSGANPKIKLTANGNAGGHALWTMLSTYRIPAPVHDYMLNKRNGYWARMHNRYTDDHYATHSWPKYFNKNGTFWDRPKEREPVPEAYFATPDFMNVSGSRFERFKVKYDKVKTTVMGEGPVTDYDFLAVPQVILTPGLTHKWSSLNALNQDVPLIPGEHARWYKSVNSGTYKSFSYGYFHRDKKARHQQWAIRLPAKWAPYLYNEGNKSHWSSGRAQFRFYDFTKVSEAKAGRPAGFYVVVAKVSKSNWRHTYRHYARGFWEVVPKSRFASAQALKSHVLSKNPSSHFQNNIKTNPGKAYVYRMTNGDVLTLEDILGSASVERCYTPIISVKTGGQTINVKNMRCHATVRGNLPLLRVDEINPKTYRNTGETIAYASGNGKLRVWNRFIKEGFELNSIHYKKPSRTLLRKK